MKDSPTSHSKKSMSETGGNLSPNDPKMNTVVQLPNPKLSTVVQIPIV